MATLLRHHVPLLATWFHLVAGIVAQCPSVLQPGCHAPGASGTVVDSTAWDPDGSGPLPEHLVVAGSFHGIGSVTTPGLSMRDPWTGAWSPVGAAPGAPSTPMAIVAMPNGDLVVAGKSGVTDAIARWNGSAWTQLPAGFPMVPTALLALPNGDLVAGGYGGASRWNGSTWTPLGPATGGLGGVIYSLALAANGDVLAGGTLTVGGTPTLGLARWNGTAWSGVGGTTTSLSRVFSILPMPNGDVYAAGWLALGGGPASVAQWDGSNWLPLGNTPPAEVYTLASLPSGHLFAGGYLTAAIWDGLGWTDVGGGLAGGSVLTAQALVSGEVIVGGAFGVVGGAVAANLAHWNGTFWLAVASGLGPNAPVTALAVDATGGLLVSGRFSAIGGVQASLLARHDGAGWAGLPSPGVPMLAVQAQPDGGIVAAGSIVSQWNGTAWSQLGSPNGVPSPRVRCLARLADDTLVVAGRFSSVDAQWTGNVAAWDGATWSPLGGVWWDEVMCMATAPNGTLFAGGNITDYSAGIEGLARWDGTAWRSVGTGFQGQVMAMLVDRDGGLVVAGEFQLPGGTRRSDVARWHGGVWTSLGLPASPRFLRALIELPNGDIVVGGHSTTGDALLRYDGASWQPFTSSVYYSVEALALHGDELVVAGDLRSVGGQRVDWLVRLATACPATVASLGSGCAGGVGGQLTMGRPWLGSDWRSRGDLLPGNLACAVLGFATTSVPLQGLLPIGRAGCSLLVQPVAQVLLPVNQSSAERSVRLPEAAALLGVVVHEQWLVLNGTVELLATDALTATLGAM